jgi:S-adenosylmethionine decarboxylase
LSKLAEELEMKVISGPFAYSAHEMGFGGWVHWKTSGSHFYSYPTSSPLFTVDIYTCKPFSLEKAVEFTRRFLSAYPHRHARNVIIPQANWSIAR